MRPIDISINNLKRRKSRVIFLLLGLLIGVGTIVALTLISQTMRMDIDRKIDEFGANILIVPKSDQLALAYGGITVSGISFDVKELTTDDVSKIKTIKNYDNISTVSPKLLGAVKIKNKQVLLVGVNFDDELRIKKWWEIEGTSPEKKNNLLIGSDVAQKLKLMKGSKAEINKDTYEVSGILKETGGQEDSLIYIDLIEAQKIMSKAGKISLIEISALCQTCPIEEIVRQLSEKMPQAKVSALKQTVASKEETLNQFTTFSTIISLVVALIGSIIVFTTTMSSVNERTREIGIFRAIGYRRTHVARIILTEIIIVSISGGIGGYLLGALGSVITTTYMSELSINAAFWNPVMAILAILIALLIGIAGGIYPAVKASNKDPATALRTL